MSNVSMCHTRTPKPPSNYPTAPQGSPTNWWGSLFSHHNLALKLSHSHRRDAGMPRVTLYARTRDGCTPYSLHTGFGPAASNLRAARKFRTRNFGHVVSGRARV